MAGWEIHELNSHFKGKTWNYNELCQWGIFQQAMFDYQRVPMNVHDYTE